MFSYLRSYILVSLNRFLDTIPSAITFKTIIYIIIYSFIENYNGHLTESLVCGEGGEVDTELYLFSFIAYICKTLFLILTIYNQDNILHKLNENFYLWS